MTITDEELARLDALVQAATQHSPEFRGFRAVQYIKDDGDYAPNDWRVLGDFSEPGMYGSVSVADMMTREGAEFLMRAFRAMPALVAEVRRLRVDLAGVEGARMHNANTAVRVTDERDALRAENERLRAEIEEHEEHCHRVMAIIHESKHSVTCEPADGVRQMANTIEELRASLADAVGKIALMEPVVEAAKEWRDSDSTERAAAAASWLWAAVDAYEASLPNLVKASPGGGDAP